MLAFRELAESLSGMEKFEDEAIFDLQSMKRLLVCVRLRCWSMLYFVVSKVDAYKTEGDQCKNVASKLEALIGAQM